MQPTRRPWIGPVSVAVVLHLALTALYLSKHHGDLSSLACVGEERAGVPPYDQVTTAIGPYGYDGQYYYLLARAPWHRQEQGLYAIDLPGVRQLRILYPLVCWLFSGGNSRLLFWVMPGVNLAAVAGMAALAVWLAVSLGRSPWWGAALPVAVNASMPALHDLTDPLSTLAVFGLLVAWLAAWPGWTLVLWAAAAVFCREQNVAVVGLVALGCLWKRRPGPALGLTATLGLWGAWVLLLRHVYGVWPFLPGHGHLGPPFSGMAFRWTHLGGNLAFSRRLAIIFGLSMVHLTLQLGLALYATAWRGDGLVKLTMLGGVGLAVVAGGPCIYSDFWSYTRAFVWMPMGIWLGSVQAGRAWPIKLLTPAVLWPLAAALNYV